MAVAAKLSVVVQAELRTITMACLGNARAADVGQVTPAVIMGTLAQQETNWYHNAAATESDAIGD